MGDPERHTADLLLSNRCEPTNVLGFPTLLSRVKTGSLKVHTRSCAMMANRQKASKSELEQDSGFSDASSGYFSGVDQSEFEDIRSSTSAAQSMQSGPRVPLVPGSCQGVSPMIKMNNIVLKQPSPWGFNSQLEMVPHSPVVLLQPVVPSGNCTSQTPISQPRESKHYIPILNSFLKIAPYPVHGATGDHGQRSTHKSSSGRTHSGRRRHSDKHSRGLSLKQDVSDTTTTGFPSGDPCMFSRSFENVDSPAKLPDLQEPDATTSPFSAYSDSYHSLLSEECPEATCASSDDAKSFPLSDSPSSSKRKRFCNTYNILNRSGLLGITMRTKELIRQNKHSQAQLQKLQAHTDLFLEAMSSRDPQVWAKLQLTLQGPASEESKEDTLGNTGLDGTTIACV